MKKIALILMILGSAAMATAIEKIEVNGVSIPLIFEQDKRLPIVNMQFIFQNSGAVASGEKAGLAKLSAKLLNEGTKEMGSSAYAEALESRAIHISASAGQETLVVEMSALKEGFDDGVSYFDKLLKDPNFSPEALKKVKTSTLGSLAAKENDFDYIASNELKALLFKDTVLAQSSLGTKKSIQGIELGDVEKFLQEALVSSKLVVVCGGDVELADVKEKVLGIVKSMQKGSLGEVKSFAVVKEPQEKIVKKDTQQAYIYFGSPYAVSIDSPDLYKAKVATFILGSSGFGSRLMEEIRVKKGLAYSAYARADISKTGNFMSGYLQTKLDSMQDAKKSVSAVVEKFVSGGVTADELEQTKKFLLGSEPLRVETMSQRLNRTFMEFYNGKEMGESQRELKKIENLTLKELNEFIKSHKELLELSFAIVTK